MEVMIYGETRYGKSYSEKDAHLAGNEIFKAALEYAEKGYYVLPLMPLGKAPLLKHGVKNASRDPIQISKWWAQYPDANVGIATGENSGVFVVDVDFKGFSAKDALAVSTTGKGNHFYFKYGEDEACFEHFNVFSDGEHVVAPPSIHTNGEKYKWQN